MRLLRLLKVLDYVLVMDRILKYPIFPETRAEFNIKNTPKYRKPAMCKFSSIQDVLNGFILDGIVANYKAAELPLIHQHLQNAKKYD